MKAIEKVISIAEDQDKQNQIRKVQVILISTEEAEKTIGGPESVKRLNEWNVELKD